MVDYVFGNDTILNMPPTGTVTFAGLTDAPYTFNPFGTVTGINDGGTPNNITMSLAFFNVNLPGPEVHAGTLFTVFGGVTTATAAGGTVVISGVTAAAAAAWLQSAFVVDDSLNDAFRLSLRSIDGDGLAGTNQIFTFRLACYVRGTLIATPAGQVPVEALRIGDMVTTLDGSAKPVKWIGHRTYEAGFGAAEPCVRPVLFRAGSLGDGLPTRDLRVSAQHGMLVDGVLVPAASLVNGVSVVRDDTVADVEYFHIELDAHEVLLAEGAPSESYIDLDSRAMFDNADEFGLLYGSDAGRPATCAPIVEEGYQVAAIRRRLARIAGIATERQAPGALRGTVERIENGILHGWIMDSANPSEPVELDVLVDGEPVARVLANRYRVDLDQAGLGNGRCAFSVAVPASAEHVGQITLRRTGDGSMIGSHVTSYAIV